MRDSSWIYEVIFSCFFRIDSPALYLDSKRRSNWNIQDENVWGRTQRLSNETPGLSVVSVHEKNKARGHA